MSFINQKRILFATVAANVLIVPQVLAQSAPSEESAESSGEILVTARRIEERLQDVPISVAVVDQEQLSKANIVSAEDLAKVVPGLNVQSRYSSEQSSFAIRGFAQETRTSASVGTYFGEVVAPRAGNLSLNAGDGAGPGSLFDLQNVQVLKGPQGTLFGRNTTGGAVLLVPRKPTDKFEGYVEGSYGNYSMFRIQGVINVPLASWARLRLGVDRQTRDGYEHNVSGVGPSEFSDIDYIVLRGSLVLDFSPDIDNYTIVSHSRSDNHGTLPQVFTANPLAGFGALAVPQVTRLNAGNDPYQIEQKLINPRAYVKQFQVINTTTWQATDNLTIKNIASYSTIVQDLRQDIFATNFQRVISGQQAYISSSYSFNPTGLHTNDQKNITEELQFQGKAVNGQLDYQFGLYYEHSTPGGLSAGGSPSSGATCLLTVFNALSDTRCLNRPNAATLSSGTIEFINMAAYAQATYALTDQLKLTGGIRYTYDRARGSAQSFRASYVGAPGQFVAPTITGCATGYTASADPATNCLFSARTSDKKPTWTLSLAYKPIEDLLIYGTYSRGYRQGAVTPFAAAGIPVFGPEKVDSYELGAKLGFKGAVSGNINIAAFYSKLTNQQLQLGLLDSSGTNAAATSILNAGKSRIYGLEFDGLLRFSDLFRLNASGTYLNTRLQSAGATLVFPGFDIVNPTALVGDPLPYSPKWGLVVGGTFTVPADKSMGTIELGATYRYSSSFSSAASSSLVRTPPINLNSTPISQLDLNLDWRNIGGSSVDLALFGSNVTKQFTQGVVLPLFNSFGFDVRYLGPPRTFGVRLKVRFGEGS